MEVHVIQPNLNEAIFGAKAAPPSAASGRGHAARQSARRQRGDKIKGFCAAAAAKSHGGKRARAERAPAVFVRRSGLAAARFSARQPRDYSYRMPRTARREALLSALSLKNREGKLIVVDKFELEAAKTKIMVQALAELKVASAVIVIAASRCEDRTLRAQSAQSQSAACRGLERLRSAALRAPDSHRMGAQNIGRKVGGMKGPQEIIQAPLISEKGTALTESANQVLFKVRPDANKIEVKQAVESIVQSQSGASADGALSRQDAPHRPQHGAALGLEKGLRTLKEGDKIDFFGGA